MQKITRALAVFAVLILGAAAPPEHVFAQNAPIARPQPVAVPPTPAKPYLDENLANQVATLEEKIKRENASAVGQPAEPFRRDAQTALSRGEGRRALGLARNAVAADSGDYLNWIVMARAAQAIGEYKDYSERYQLQELGSVGAYGGFMRAKTANDQAAALAVLGAVYQKSESWRQSLTVYRASLSLADQPVIRRTYEQLREKYGFRILNYTVDSDAAAPRACFDFSENLKRDKADFSSFVAVTGNQGTSISAENAQLCVEGLKHGERYNIVLRQGIPSDVGEDLLKAADYTIYVRDRSAAVRFTGKNYVLPKTGQQGIPVVTINTSSVALEIFSIGDRSLLPTIRSEDFLEQVSGSTAAAIASEKGRKIWSGTLDTKSDLNQDIVTAFPVSEAVKDMQPGIYVMFAKPPGTAASADGEEDYSTRATQWFVVSDLGLTAFTGNDGVHVLVRSLASAAPVGGVEVKLVAKNNEVLGTARSDANGYARFDPGLARGTEGLAPALLTVSDGKSDHGFLDLQQTAFDLTDRGVKGRAAPGPLDAFLYAERGVYRSGETVYVTTMLRDAAGNAVSGVPLTTVVSRPDGVEYKRQIVADQGLGGRSVTVPLLSSVQTGTWRVAVYSDPKRPAIGSTTFLVEDYVPERLELDLKPVQPYVRPGEPVTIDTAVRYLYGAVGSDLDITGDYRIDASDEIGLPALKGYQVGLTDETFEAVTGELDAGGTTDAQGRAKIVVPLQETTAPRPLKAAISIHVSENGGRAITRSVSVPIVPAGSLIGVKPLFDVGALTEGSKAEFDAVLVGGEGRRIARSGVKWVLNRVDRRYQWFFKDGRWNFESTKIVRAVANGTVDMAEGTPARIGVPVKLGSYRLDVQADGLKGAETSVSFSVGWDGERTANTPDVLDMTLDKKAYAAGETMKLKLDPRFGVKATLAIVSDKLQDITIVDVPASGDTVSLPVKSEWGAGAYVVALAHRPLDVAAQRAPGRSIGIAWFAIEKSAKVLSVELSPPKTIAPRGKLSIPLKLAGLKAGDEAYVAVAAVDVGILNLTRYQAPEPSEYFYGQRQLALELRDLYGFLIDGLQGTRGAIRSGGDAAAPASEGPPPIFEPLARYSGVTKVRPDGTALIEFDVPAFNGTVRVMATAWSANQVGEGKTDVIIRDPVVLQGTLPRFLNVGDQSRFHIALDNVEGPAGDYIVDIDAHGPVSVPADALRTTLKLAKGQKTSLTLPVTAAGLGTARFDVRLKGQGIDITQSLTLRVQPSASTLVRRSVRPLPGGGTLNLSSDLLADTLAGSGSVSVSVSPLTSLDVPALLKQLDRYPYGCTEQTVSRAMPLLYVNRLEAQERFGLDEKADDRVRAALEKVLNRQSSNGSFGLWSVGGEDLWLNAFVGDFLTRAREQNFSVPQKGFDLALDQLRNSLVNASDVKADTAAGLAYSAYVLARNGRPVMGDLRYLVDTKLDEFGTPLSRAQLGAALALLGDKGRAATAFKSALDLLDRQRTEEVWRADYGSKLRDSVATVALLAETNGSRADIQRASAVVERARDAARYTSTQEQGWMVIAAQALAKDADGMALTLDGKPVTGALYRTVSQAKLEDAPIAIMNTGQNALRAVVSVSGVPLTPEPAADQGFKVERFYYSMSGQPIDVNAVKQNTRFIVSLKVTERTARTGRLLLVDPLPAGIEIDNPSLVEGSIVPDAEWLKREVEPANTEYRDDRFVAAFDRSTDQPASFQVAYIVRAVSPGHYVRPGASIEDMYRPERFGRTETGTLDVTAAR